MKLKLIITLIPLLLILYYVKSYVLHIDLIENKHFIFLNKPLDSYRQLKQNDKIIKELLMKANRGEKIDGWFGISRDGKHTYNNGNIAWAGSVHTIVNFPKDQGIIGVMARGSKAKGKFPYMVVELNKKEIGCIYVDSADWREYSFEAKQTKGQSVLTITYVNDTADPINKEDRNLYLGSVRVFGP